MKPCVLVLAVVFAATLFVPATLSAKTRVRSHDNDNLCRGDDVSVDFEDGSILFTDKDSDETVVITERAELFVNARSVRLSRGQRALVMEYHETLAAIVDEAKSIGLQGAKVGAKGAGLGLKAAFGVLMLLAPGYGADDLEADLEEDEQELERAARKLERRAERLERRADRFKRLHKALRNDIDELDELGWF